MTSIDWMESTGIWLEKVLLVWSVIGWSSMENEFSAWSPNPWIWPSESEAMPGVARPTSELIDDDPLPKGTLSNNSLSMSEWKVGSFSTISPVSSTVTVSELPATVKLTVTFTGTADRVSTSCAY